MIPLQTGHLWNQVKSIALRMEMFLFNDALNTFYLRLYGIRLRGRKPAAATWATLFIALRGAQFRSVHAKLMVAYGTGYHLRGCCFTQVPV